jgi:UDP-2,4-diacetamido-2,4,6-trideoxy-beta-L-altropyranose hydrolase
MNSNPAPKLLIRADAGPQIGAGHLMRCLALAQAWQDSGGDCLFASAPMNSALQERLAAEGFGRTQIDAPPGSDADARATIEAARQHNAGTVVLDGYGFDAGFQEKIKLAGFRLLVLDDYGHARHYWADWILNQNLRATPEMYRNREAGGRLLLGSQYVLLRREFRKWRDWVRDGRGVARNILVSLGGSDPANATPRVLQALRTLARESWEGVVIAGPANPNRAAIEATSAKCGLPAQVVQNPDDLPSIMARADLAVSGAGATCWELAFMGVPAVLLVLADNQKVVAEPLAAAGAAWNLGALETATPAIIGRALQSMMIDTSARQEMSRRGRALIDGEGCARVLMRLTGQRLRLRRARLEDSRLILEWANEPEARAWSFASGFISQQEHDSWFHHQLRDPACAVYLGVDEQDRPVGQVRFQRHGAEEADVSLNLSKDWRGLGLGSLLLSKGLETITRETPVRVVHAWIKERNLVSKHVFAKAGFGAGGLENVKGHSAWHFVWRRPTIRQDP